ncbi:MAG: YbaK/EbsC family protein [Candidatus Latescibacteria bacterium]|nr:YbaK/EbsC family protein [Candidatus Latescibacterota bacterium]
MPSQKLKDFLDTHGIKYRFVQHSPAYTTQEVAASAHISGKDMAKTVIIKVDGAFSMAVLPAQDQVDFSMLKESVGAHAVELADEEDFRNMFPDCEVGAMPPFGSLYGIAVYVSESLPEDEEIAFNAGSHREIIMMGYKDFERLEKPSIVKM